MKKDKRKIIGIAGTFLVHLAFFVLLLLIYIRQPEETEESGVPVMLGNVDLSQGMFDPSSMTEVDIVPEETIPEEGAVKSTEQEIITQAEEETVTIKPKTEPKPKEKRQKPEVKKTVEKTEAQKRAEAEKAAADAASKRIAGAFGKGSKMDNKGTGTTGTGIEGSLQGNSSTGKSSGVGGYGTLDLNGRSVGKGGLPRPIYNVKDEGTVVVTIVVNSAGIVVSTSINKKTNTVNSALRKAAEDAAKKARFNTVDGVNNQMGTITYSFKLN
ncbi:MAG: TonB family protein [Bacteroides sp.]